MRSPSSTWPLGNPQFALRLFLLEYFINDTVNIGFIAVGMTASGVQSRYEGLKVRKLSLTVIGAIQTLIALIAILAFVGQVVLQLSLIHI